MSYTLNYGPNGNIPLPVQDGQSATIGNIIFPGRNFSGYGSPVDQNFLSMNENFASANYTGPQYAIPGQLWFDIANGTPISGVNTGNVSYRGLKVNTGLIANGTLANTSNINANIANWSMLVTYDWANSQTTPNNPKNISGLGTISANVINISTGINAANSTITANAVTANRGNFTTSVTSPTANFTTSVTTPLINANTIVGNSFTLTGQSGTGPNIANWFVATSGGVTITVPVNIQNTLQFNAGGSSNATPLQVSSPVIEVGEITPAPSIDAFDHGLDLVYYTAGNTRIDAFMGYIGDTNPNVSLRSKFIVASSVVTNNIANNQAIVNTMGDFLAGNIGAVTAVTAPTFTGSLANGTSSVNIPAINGNISITGTGNLIANVTDTAINVVATTAATSVNSGAVQVRGGVGILGNLHVGGTIVGNISSTGPATGPSATYTGNVQGAWMVSTIGANAPLARFGTANIDANLNVGNVVASGTVSGTNGNFTTVTATAAVNSPNIYATNIFATGGAPTSGGTITGAWTLNGTFEATYAADLAERHHSDAVYPVGTVMTVGGANEITAASQGSKVLGVVSENWAYLMNGAAGENDTHPGVAYVGRVPVRVVGPIGKHSRISPIDGGVAVASADNSFGWALETNTDPAEKLVMCIVK